MVLEFLLSLVETFGYLGVFLGSLIGSASILLPVPAFAFIVVAGRLLDPLLVGLLAGLGSAIGELVAYGVGAGIVYGRMRFMEKKQRKKQRIKTKHEKKWFHTINTLFRKRWGFPLIILFALTPLPDDILGLYCGAIRYDIKKFFIATLIGKIILSLSLAYFGFYGFGLVEEYFLVG